MAPRYRVTLTKEEREDLEWSAPYCTACTPKTDVTQNIMHDGPCTACEDGSWLDVSEAQDRIDDESEWNDDFEGVVADFGRCRLSCTADEYQSGTGCATKKTAGESCGGSSDVCASGMCGGSYCCNEAAASISCSEPCYSGTCCSLCEQNSGQCVSTDSCSLVIVDPCSSQWSWCKSWQYSSSTLRN